jgi:hypothetical protein
MALGERVEREGFSFFRRKGGGHPLILTQFDLWVKGQGSELGLLASHCVHYCRSRHRGFELRPLPAAAAAATDDDIYFL